jgi:hypothetical protein
MKSRNCPTMLPGKARIAICLTNCAAISASAFPRELIPVLEARWNSVAMEHSRRLTPRRRRQLTGCAHNICREQHQLAADAALRNSDILYVTGGPRRQCCRCLTVKPFYDRRLRIDSASTDPLNGKQRGHVTSPDSPLVNTTESPPLAD